MGFITYLEISLSGRIQIQIRTQYFNFSHNIFSSQNVERWLSNCQLSLLKMLVQLRFYIIAFIKQVGHSSTKMLAFFKLFTVRTELLKIFCEFVDFEYQRHSHFKSLMSVIERIKKNKRAFNICPTF